MYYKEQINDMIVHGCVSISIGSSSIWLMKLDLSPHFTVPRNVISRKYKNLESIA